MVHNTDIDDIRGGFVENPVQGALVILLSPSRRLEITVDMLLVKPVDNPLSLVPDRIKSVLYYIYSIDPVVWVFFIPTVANRIDNDNDMRWEL